MGDNDPLAMTDALLARYRTGAESGALPEDFPILTEIVDPSPQPADNAALPEEGANAHNLKAPTNPESGDPATRLEQAIKDKLGADFTNDLAMSLAAVIRPVIDEFTGRMASEIAAAFRQEISRILSEATAAQAARRTMEDQGIRGPIAD